ncbi:MAG: TonB-dependent siderophore receptor [Leptolyngbyaceae cyanobacterium bins.302]|nr:TonB-dependent siderophore receptor [Leptolyngbyaceae cyanobacterium bins.302]
MKFYPVHSAWLTAILFSLITQSVQAQTAQQTQASRLRDLNRPVTTVQAWLVQLQKTKQETQTESLVLVTGVKLDRTDAGLEIVLETDGKPLTIDASKFRAEGKSLIADIPNTVLALPEGKPFEAANPATDVSTIRITQEDASTIRISVVGTKAPPTTEITLKANGLAYSLNAEGEDDDELVVIGERQTPYRAPSSGTATGTNIPILETPFSIQVIPQEVLRDQQVTRIEDAVRNVSGITSTGDAGGRRAEITIRGFQTAPILQDGFRRYGSFQVIPELANLEQIEVVKGPASILFGEIQPGGVINLVSKQPLSKPFYETELQLGSRGFVRPRFDISGPLTADGSILYRLNGVYQRVENVADFNSEDRRFSIAPTLAFKISDRTDLNLSLEYLDTKRSANFGLPVIGRRVVDVSRDFVSSDPSDLISTQYLNTGYNFEHRFSQNWKFRNAFRYSSYDYNFNIVALPFGFNEVTATIRRVYGSQEGQNENIALQTNVLGEFTTGSIGHTLLFGVDLNRSKDRIFSIGDFITGIPLNVFNPVYGVPPRRARDTLPPFGGNDITTSRLGIYVQDQISLLSNLKLLAGIRYDTVEQTNERLVGLFTLPGETSQNDDAFTPRLGLLYQPIKNVSLYGSYSRSFTPNTATTSAGNVLEPERGEGYEFGIKAELIDRKLFATVAYFDITKQNVAVGDPNFPLFSVATGEQRSRGVEIDIAGEILPGWNIIASYANINAEITKDSNPRLIGNRLFGTPTHSASLWTTYEIQQGDLQGLGFGTGFNAVGERAGDLANTYEAPGYFVANAAIFYRRGSWRFALNFRNLGDAKYIESTTNSRSSGNFFGEPFTVIGSVSYQF